MITSVGASAVSNNGPVAGTRPRASSSTRSGWRNGQWSDVAHGERGPVGERGARADDDRLRVGAQLVGVGAGRVGR